MTTRPTRIAQTSTEAKKLHKRNGSALPERQQRQLERGAELEKRAARLREAEERRKSAKKRREEREKKDKEARKQAGVGLATQLIGYSRTQARLKSGMEAFLGFNKRRQEERKKELEVAERLEAIVEEVVREPWDDDAAEEDFNLSELDTAGGEQWLDDDLDDDTLLEVHDLIMSDPIDESKEVQQLPVPAPVPEAKCPPSKENLEFVRLHGPTNKAIERILDKIPEPLIELLSQDISIKPEIWNPAPSLLHKLNPTGFPPHRLRIKVGCVVTLLRDLNNSTQLSKGQHLRFIRKEKENLECLVLDGQLEGTETTLTHLSFSAEHRNDEKCPYQRIQFPIEVSQDWNWNPRDVPREMPQSTFKPHSTSGHVLPLTSIGKKPPSSVAPKSKPKQNPNPSFRLPGMPASKAKPLVPSKLADPPGSLLVGWDEFLDSGSQIARELSSESSSPIKIISTTHTVPSAFISRSLPPLLPQDLDFSLEDLDFSLEDLDKEPHYNPLSEEVITPIVPSKTPRTVPHSPLNPPKKSTFPRTNHPFTSKHKMAPPLPPSQQSISKRKTVGAMATSGPPPTKRVAHVQPSLPVIAHVQPGRVMAAPKVEESVRSLSEFGLSTQEALSFFEDDDDLGFGSPPIAI